MKKIKTKKTTKKIKKLVKTAKKKVAQKVEKPIGIVTHFYDKIRVGVVKLKKDIAVGVRVAVRGTHTDFKDAIISMQFDHEQIKKAKKGKSVGVKFKKRVREGDSLYLDK